MLLVLPDRYMASIETKLAVVSEQYGRSSVFIIAPDTGYDTVGVLSDSHV
jgi:hypothetical protein